MKIASLNPGVEIPIDVEKFNGPAATNQGFDLVWAKDIKTDLSNEYVIKNLLGSGGMSVVYGESNSGKSFFAIDLAMHIATNQQWRTRKVKSGVVLYVASEGPRSVERRIKAHIDHITKESKIPLAVIREAVNLLIANNGDVTRLIQLCTDIEERHGKPVVLIIFDTLARSMPGGNENAFEDMSRVVNHADTIRNETGAHVMFIHHSGKDTAKGARGHSSLRAATDTEIEVFAGTDQGQKSHTAVVLKQRDYEIGDEFYFTLSQVEIGTDQDGDLVTTCLLEIADTGISKNRRSGKLGKNQKIALDALESAIKRGGLGDFVPLNYWHDEFSARYLTLEGKESTRYQWRDAKKGLAGKSLYAFDSENNTVRLA